MKSGRIVMIGGRFIKTLGKENRTEILFQQIARFDGMC